MIWLARSEAVTAAPYLPQRHLKLSDGGQVGVEEGEAGQVGDGGQVGGRRDQVGGAGQVGLVGSAGRSVTVNKPPSLLLVAVLLPVPI